MIQLDKQLVLPGLNSNSVLITNIGMGCKIDELLRQSGAENLLLANNLLGNYHQCGNDEVANRASDNHRQ